MCDEYTRCYRAGWEVQLRFTPVNTLVCCDCWGGVDGDAPDWDQLRSPDDAIEIRPTKIAHMAHARRSAQWEARL